MEKRMSGQSALAQVGREQRKQRKDEEEWPVTQEKNQWRVMSMKPSKISQDLGFDET